MAIHIITKHEDDPNLEKKWKCDLCEDKKFASKVVFERHKELHKKFDKSGRTLKCEVCEYPFLPGDQDKLKKHMENFHDKTKKSVNQCTVEGCEFTSRQKFQMRRHEGDEHPELLIYSCGPCGKSYSSPVLLEIHTRTHGTGPFGCSVCKTVCPTGNELAQHLARHNGESIHPCDQCDLLFRNISLLIKHKMVKHNAPPGPTLVPSVQKSL
ncbi:PR domain zinc finger protein 5-like [Folsomia candida]|nr:PR domain zinc finger protein 5-like [Folsomia candida]